MRFTTKTEYGLICLIYIARQKPGHMVSVKEIVERERFSSTYIEKILQKLRAAHIVIAHHGKQGGYELARAASQITLKEIIEALEGGATFDMNLVAGGFCGPEVREKIVCTHFSMCGLKPVWQKTKDLLDHFYHSMTLDMISGEPVKELMAG